MQGASEIIIVHEGEEYVLHIARTGKLILFILKLPQMAVSSPYAFHNWFRS